MTYYRRVGDIPRKRHTLHRVDGAGRRRGDGRRGGLLRTVEPALPPPLAERDRGHRRRRRHAAIVHAEPTGRPLPPPYHQAAGGAGRRGHGADCVARQRRRSAAVRHRHDDEPAVPQRRGRRAGLRAVGQRHAGERVRQPAGDDRRLRRRADRRDASLGRRSGRRGCRAARPPIAQPHPHPAEVPHADRPARRRRAVSRSATCAVRTARCSSTARTSRCSCAHVPGSPGTSTATTPSTSSAGTATSIRGR